MEKPTKIRIPQADGDLPGTIRDACLVHIYPTGPGMGLRYSLGETPLVLGRDRDCELCIDDQSVSRRHARVDPRPEGFQVVDLQSTNGTFRNETRISQQLLEDGDYLRIGNTIFRYLAGGNVEAAYHEEIYRLTIVDALTGIHNKRYLLEVLEREVARSTRYGRPLALALFDLDRFKAINDEYGHLAGDATLRELAARVKSVVRKEDLLARYGGEEFAVVMPETSVGEGMLLAERIRAVVAAQPFHYEDRAFPVTISLGVVGTAGAPPMISLELIARADDHLYQAKREGRNRVVG